MYVSCYMEGGILTSFKIQTFDNATYFFLYTVCLCAVNGFAIISGYTVVEKKQNYSKIIEMWFQVFFYSFILTFLCKITGFYNMSWKELLKCALPVAAERYWYFTAYFGLFFTMPILNKFIFLLNERIAKICFIITIFLFSVIGLPGDAFKLCEGYSMIWLIVLYMIGAFAKIGRIFEKKRIFILAVLFAFCIALTWASNMLFGTQVLITYTSPTILMCGLIIVIVFSRLNIQGNFIRAGIKKISSLVFGVYLFQLNPVIWKHMEDAFVFVLKKNIYIGVIYVLVISGITFLVGLCVESFRKVIAEKIKIVNLSKTVVEFASSFLEKMIVVLQ